MSTDDRDSRRSAVERYAPERSGTSSLEDTKAESMVFYKREKESRGRVALAMTIVLKNGNRFTVEYAHRTEMQFDPEVGVELFYSTGVKITIKGQFLAKLYDDLAEHRVLELRSVDKLQAYYEHHKSDVTGKELPLVEDIILERGIMDANSGGIWKASSGKWNSINQQWQPSVLN